jgi:hypothetical protein
MHVQLWSCPRNRRGANSCGATSSKLFSPPATAGAAASLGSKFVAVVDSAELELACSGASNLDLARANRKQIRFALVAERLRVPGADWDQCVQKFRVT